MYSIVSRNAGTPGEDSANKIKLMARLRERARVGDFLWARCLLSRTGGHFSELEGSLLSGESAGRVGSGKDLDRLIAG
jgi:hypothetical protein